jgi:hypothetical protein
MPAASPVAFDEQLVLGIASVMCVEKFVQPLNCRYDLLSERPSYFSTELTTIVWG